MIMKVNLALFNTMQCVRYFNYLVSWFIGPQVNMAIIDDKSTLVRVLAWCRQTTNNHLIQCWSRSLSAYGILGHNELTSMKMNVIWPIYNNIIAATTVPFYRHVWLIDTHSLMGYHVNELIWHHVLIFIKMTINLDYMHYHLQACSVTSSVYLSNKLPELSH